MAGLLRHLTLKMSGTWNTRPGSCPLDARAGRRLAHDPALQTDGMLHFLQSEFIETVPSLHSVRMGSTFFTALNVLANDSDPDGDPLTIISVTQPVGGNGTVRISGSQVIFTPKNPFLIDSFTYTISDGKGGTATGMVELIDP